MYRGDGSYKPSEYEPEVSFVELIEKENEIVNRVNASASAYESAKKNGLRTKYCLEEYNSMLLKLEACRKEIKDYLTNKIGIAFEISNNKSEIKS